MKHRLLKAATSAAAFCILSGHAVAETSQNGHERNFLYNANVMRIWRVALPVTKGAFETDFGSDKQKVLAFWNNMEQYLNEIFTPTVGYAFKVIQDEKLMNVVTTPNDFDTQTEDALKYPESRDNMEKLLSGTDYDAGLWIVKGASGISGLTIKNAAYTKNGRTQSYCSNNEIHVCHELGHLFGASHVQSNVGASLEPLDGQSLMSYGIPHDFLSLYSVNEIRTALSSSESSPFYYDTPERTTMMPKDYAMSEFQKMIANVVYGIATPGDEHSPRLSDEVCKETYTIPEGACFKWTLNGTDPLGYPLKFACQPVKQPVVSRGLMTLRETSDGVVDYKPLYRAYDNQDKKLFYLADGGDPTTVQAGDYIFWMAAIRQPKYSLTYDNLIAHPYYPAIDGFQTKLTIVSGTPFKAKVADEPTDHTFEQGQKVTVTWGVNNDYFKSGMKVRLLLSTDFGQTFPYVLREGVDATSGKCEVVLPAVSINKVSFGGTKRMVRGGIIKVEEEDGIAYTLTCLNPGDATGHSEEGGFLVKAAPVKFTGLDNPFVSVASKSELPAQPSVIAMAGNQSVPVTFTQTDEPEGVMRQWAASYNGKTYYATQLIHVGKAETLTLDEKMDNSALVNSWNNRLADVTVKRQFKTGKWNTVCLPFSVSAEEVARVFGTGTEIADLVSSNDNGNSLTLSFEMRQAMQGGRPYLIKPKTTTDVENPTFYGVKISNVNNDVTCGNVTFKGNDKPFYMSVSQNSMLFLSQSSQTLAKPSVEGLFSALKAYFVATGDNVNSKQFVLEFQGVATNIAVPNAVRQYSGNEAYSLAGQRVSDNYKGVVIVNGKKVLRK